MRAVVPVTAGLLGALSALAVGCGSSSSKLLSATDAAGLKDTLAQVRSAVDARNCATTKARTQELHSEVGNLPGSVDRALRVRLRQEIDGKLVPKALDECDDPKTETIPTTTETTPTGPTGPTGPTDTTPPTDTGTPSVPETDTGDTTGTVPPVPSLPDPTTPTPSVPVPDPTTNPGGAGPTGP